MADANRRRVLATLGAAACAPVVGHAQDAGECVVMPVGVVQPPAVGLGSFHPADVASTVAYYARGDWTASGGRADSWTDSSGNNFHSTQNDVAQQPHVLPDNSSLSWPDAGGPYGLNVPSITFARLYAVVQYRNGLATTFSSFPRLMGGASSSLSGPFVAGDAGRSRFYRSNGDLFATRYALNGSAESAPEAVLPMVNLVLRADSNSTWTSQISIGHSPTGFGQCWRGLIGAFLLTDGTEAEEVADKYVGHLAHEAGIQASLVAGHPYRNAPP